MEMKEVQKQSESAMMQEANIFHFKNWLRGRFVALAPLYLIGNILILLKAGFNFYKHRHEGFKLAIIGIIQTLVSCDNPFIYTFADVTSVLAVFDKHG